MNWCHRTYPLRVPALVSRPQNSPMQRALRYIVLIVIAAAAIAAFVWFGAGTAEDKKPKPPANSSPIRITAYVVQEEPFAESLTLGGTVLAAEAVNVYAEVGGRITAVEFREGALVSTGQVLVRLNDAEQRARLDRLRAQYQVDSVRMKRLEMLRTIDGVSLQEYDEARAQVQMRKAEIDELLATLDRLVVRAPFGGTVGLRHVSPGAVITPQTLISTLADIRTLKIEVPIPDRYAKAVPIGSTLRFVARNRAGADTMVATVYAADPVADEATRSIRVRARCAGNASLVPGTIVDVMLQTSTSEKAMLIPSASIQPGMKGSSVFVVNNGVAREVDVHLGGRTPGKVHVLDAINPGDTIATSGLLVLKNGLRVKVDVE